MRRNGRPLTRILWLVVKARNMSLKANITASSLHPSTRWMNKTLWVAHKQILHKMVNVHSAWCKWILSKANHFHNSATHRTSPRKPNGEDISTRSDYKSKYGGGWLGGSYLYNQTEAHTGVHMYTQTHTHNPHLNHQNYCRHQCHDWKDFNFKKMSLQTSFKRLNSTAFPDGILLFWICQGQSKHTKWSELPTTGS